MTTTPVANVGRRGLLLAGLGATAALAGCAQKAETGSGKESGSSGGTLTIVGYPQEITEDTIKAFQAANPGTKVTLIPYTWDKVTTMLAAGNAPDLIRGEGVNDTAYLQHKGLAEPLDDYLAKSSVLKADDLMPINDVWRHDGTNQGQGKLYGLVKDYSSDLCVWVNKKLVKDMPSLTEPMTYEELLQRAKAATVFKGGTVDIYGLDSYLAVKPHITWMNAMVASDGGKLFNDDLSQVDLTSASAVKFLQWNLDLMRAKASLSPIAPSAQGPNELFMANRLAMFMSGYWTQGLIQDAKAVKENSVMVPCPQLGSTRISPVISGSGMWMPAKAKQKELAWKFMEFYFGGQPAKERAGSGWGIPALKSMQSLIPTTTELQKATLKTQEVENKYFKVMNFTPYAKVDAINSTMGKIVDKALKGNADAQSVAQECHQAVNDLLKAGKR